MPSHLTPIENPAPVVMLTGDPRRAFALAGDLMEQPRMSHLARGLWGYTGTTAAGMDLTVQSTGSGGPAAAAVLGDLAGLGVRTVVRMGTCVLPGGATGAAAGSAILVERALCCDGASSALNGREAAVWPDPGLFERLSGVAPPGVVSSHDLVARFDPREPGPAEGALVRDLQTASVLTLSRKLGLAAAAVLVVSGDGAGGRLSEDEMAPGFLELGREVNRRLENS